MAMATPRMSLDPPLDLSSLVNPHVLPNPHIPLPDLVPAVHSQTRRVSSESQTPGRASPSPKISRRTPVPFLLEAFPAPPSHIPGTPTSLSPSTILSPSLLGSASSWSPSASTGSAVSTSPASSTLGPSPCSPNSIAVTLPHSNPPPSSPPSGPLPPVPGPSSVTPDLFATQRALQTTIRSVSPALSIAEPRRSLSRTEQRPRPSIEGNDSVSRRRRQGSLSSLRNPIYPMAEQNETIAEEPVDATSLPFSLPLATSHSPPLFGSIAARRSHDQSRGESPDILRSYISRTAAPSLHPDDKPCAEDSIARVDISDLNALKSDNEGDGDEQASHPFPRCPPHPRSLSQSPSDSSSSAPPYVHSSQKPSMSSVCSIHVSSTSEDMAPRGGALSPEIRQMISTTPRPRKRSTPSRSREPGSSRKRTDSWKSRKGVGVPPAPTNSHIVKAASKTAWLSRDGEARDDGNESDSSLDLHTPLPQLMLRHGMLSPNSKLLPQLEEDRTRLSIMSSTSYLSSASNISLKSMASTCSKHPKDARDTPQRRVRHRDGRLLKGGIGLTTGLGWSDSEDEDAPSALTRRVSTLVLAHRASSSSVGSCRTSRSQSNSPHPLARSISHNVLREADEYENDVNEFGHSSRSSLATRSLPSRSKPLSRVGSVRSTGSSLGRYSTYSTSSTGTRTRTASVSESSIYSTSIASKADNADGHAGLMPGIREHDDGVTPTRAAFARSSLSSLNGGSGADVPHTPSSTASSASLPFPATPESSEEIPQSHPAYDKMLPPLPPSARSKYSSLGLRSQPGGLQRPRVPSNASSLSSNSVLGPPSANIKSNTPSTSSTPRQSLVERPAKTGISAASPRPSLNGTPRPSLTIPKPSFSQPLTSGLPRPTTPSLSPSVNGGQGYAPRPLRLVSRNSPLTSPTLPGSTPASANQVDLSQPPSKALQPGEQLPRPGQILTYNRNVHDQLKLRALSLNTGPDRAPGSAVSPGSTQTSITSPAVASSQSSGMSSPVTTRSQSPLPSPGPSGEGFRPKPRTGTGMMYRNNLSVGSAAGRIRVSSTISR